MSAPRCSIVIPVHDRAGLTRRCLDTILADPPRTPFEIVVVDDASDDDTATLLAEQPAPVRAVRREQNGGFAVACNDGAAAARGGLLVFLNNDTEPQAGWLDALVAYADAHPQVGIVGVKLLFPDGSVQHAGVAISQDGRPRHLYAGFPPGHPAVTRSRSLQAVTAACMLVRRQTWEDAAGFDTAFRNALEDVDLCLRVRATGGEVHYCADSVVTHLESVSRGRGSADVQENERLFRERWEGRVRPDDLDRYVEDGLLRLRYRDLYPIGIEAAPELAATLGDDASLRKLLERQQRHIAHLLREVVRLTAHIAEVELRRPPSAVGRSPDNFEEELGRVEDVELDLLELQRQIARDANGSAAAFTPSPMLTYRRLLRDIHAVVDQNVPEGAIVLVISRGDEEALDLGARKGRHFPQEPDGTYAGSYPGDSAEAVAHLEELRAQGARYLLVPSTSAWWLEHYQGFAQHLRECYRPLAERADCALYELEATP